MDPRVLYTWCYCCLLHLPRPLPQPATVNARRSTDTLPLFFQQSRIRYPNVKIAAQSSVTFAFMAANTVAAGQQNNGSCYSCDDTFIPSPAVQVFYKWNLRGASHRQYIRHLCCLRHKTYVKLYVSMYRYKNPAELSGTGALSLMVAQFRVNNAKPGLVPLPVSYTLENPECTRIVNPIFSSV